eukprot:scaffold1265_cov366-Prasinococcus_capsulatus_cf.AAC.7
MLRFPICGSSFSVRCPSPLRLPRGRPPHSVPTSMWRWSAPHGLGLSCAQSLSPAPRLYAAPVGAGAQFPSRSADSARCSDLVPTTPRPRAGRNTGHVFGACGKRGRRGGGPVLDRLDRWGGRRARREGPSGHLSSHEAGLTGPPAVDRGARKRPHEGERSPHAPRSNAGGAPLLAPHGSLQNAAHCPGPHAAIHARLERSASLPAGRRPAGALPRVYEGGGCEDGAAEAAAAGVGDSSRGG